MKDILTGVFNIAKSGLIVLGRQIKKAFPKRKNINNHHR